MIFNDFLLNVQRNCWSMQCFNLQILRCFPPTCSHRNMWNNYDLLTPHYVVVANTVPKSHAGTTKSMQRQLGSFLTMDTQIPFQQCHAMGGEPESLCGEEVAVADGSNRHSTFTQETHVCALSEAKSQCWLLLILRTCILNVVMSRHMTYLRPTRNNLFLNLTK